MFLSALCDDFGHIMLNQCTLFTLCETWHIYNCESLVGLKNIYDEHLIMIIIDQIQNFFFFFSSYFSYPLSYAGI